MLKILYHICVHSGSYLKFEMVAEPFIPPDRMGAWATRAPDSSKGYRARGETCGNGRRQCVRANIPRYSVSAYSSAEQMPNGNESLFTVLILPIIQNTTSGSLNVRWDLGHLSPLSHLRTWLTWRDTSGVVWYSLRATCLYNPSLSRLPKQGVITTDQGTEQGEYCKTEKDDRHYI